MSITKDITLDADLLRVIDANRIFAHDTTATVLRRLLKLDKMPEGWFSQGVFLPNGTKIRMGYGDNPSLNGVIVGGRWVIQHRKFDSPSTAATAFVAKGRGRSKARVNGWLYWQVLKPGHSDWALLDSLRIGNPIGLADNVHALRSVAGNGVARAGSGTHGRHS
jgi:hypothetical protein